MLIAYGLFLLGFVLVVKGADWLVEGSTGLARRMRVSELTIGLTVLAFGTSAPELFVGVSSAWKGLGELAFGNAVGASLVNVCLVLGVAGLVRPYTVRSVVARRDLPAALAGPLLMLALSVPANGSLTLGRFSGLFLLAVFAAYLWQTLRTARLGELAEAIEEAALPRLEAAAGWTLVGLVALFAGGKLVVSQATAIAEAHGMSQTLVGLTFVSLGTTLPELVTTLTAARRNAPDAALGNVVGSNIFNMLCVLGAAALVNPIRVPNADVADLFFLAGVTGLVLVFALRGPDRKIDRRESAVLVTAYVCYLGYVFWRG